MELKLQRFSGAEEDTLGLLFEEVEQLFEPAPKSISHHKFLAFTLEDQYQETKVYGETRIPAGRYEIKLRTEGGFHARYTARFGIMHKGMLHLQDVPGFTYILIHTGNLDEHTKGCILVGNTASQNVSEEGSIGASRTCYRRIYPAIAEAILGGDGAWITVEDPA